MDGIRDATPVELIRALAALADPPGARHDDIARALGLPGQVTASDFSDVFLFQLYPYASVHVGAEGMMGGDARQRVAGFWTALGRTPPAEPDHMCALLALYASLSEAEAEDDAEGALLGESVGALLHEHLAPWLPHYLARVRELAPELYAGWAGLLERALEAEAARLAPQERLPLHLREAPELTDPRAEGGEAFLSDLLATVRTGVIVTRADLAKIAAQLDLGLRAGERRYALESLLSQDAAGVLTALAAEARRQQAMHAARAVTWGSSSAFLADRAGATAELLDELVAEGFESPQDVAESVRNGAQRMSARTVT